MHIVLFVLAAPWSQYGGTLEGQRYAEDVTLTPESVHELTPAWTYRTGDTSDGSAHWGKPSNFKATPVLLRNRLIFPTAFGRIIALDPTTGEERWTFDPRTDFSHPYSEQFTSRGVATWVDPKPARTCQARVFFGTLDARLLAVDADTGRPCPDFGARGEVDLTVGIDRLRREDYSMTSPPLAVGDVVIAGSSIGDNGAAVLESGVVRAYDARTGRLRWRFDPAPSGAGAANVWTAMSADTTRGLVFLPTSSPSADFFGGHRPKDDGHANSVVALRYATGQRVWSYRIIRHDLWDLDLASQPTLLDWPTAQGPRPALLIPTKTGMVFVLDRETGQPLIRVDERSVPTSDVPGEVASATQRFSEIQLHPVAGKLPNILPLSKEHEETCRGMLKGVRYEGLFTPPSLQGTLLYPGNSGGTNWGSAAAGHGVAVMAVNKLPTVVKLIPRKDFARLARTRKLNGVDAQFTAMRGTPYGMARYDLFNRESGAFCFEGPWAQLVAVELGTGRIKWRAPAGSAAGVPASWGTYAKGGPLITGGGVAFLATGFDHTVRGYDVKSGAIVWQHGLPAGAEATPMAYRAGDREFLVVAAGGDRAEGAGRGDYLVAFSR